MIALNSRLSSALQLHTILFDAKGRTIVGVSESAYSNATEISSSVLDIARSIELHLICHDGRWIVVTRTGSSEHPVYIQHCIAPSRNDGINLIDEILE